MSKRFELSPVIATNLAQGLEAAEAAHRAYFSASSYRELYEYWTAKKEEYLQVLSQVGAKPPCLSFGQKPEAYIWIGKEWCRVTLVGSTRRGTRALWIQPERSISYSRTVWYPEGYRISVPVRSEETEALNRVIVSMT